MNLHQQAEQDVEKAIERSKTYVFSDLRTDEFRRELAIRTGDWPRDLVLSDYGLTESDVSSDDKGDYIKVESDEEDEGGQLLGKVKRIDL